MRGSNEAVREEEEEKGEQNDRLKAGGLCGPIRGRMVISPLLI